MPWHVMRGTYYMAYGRADKENPPAAHRLAGSNMNSDLSVSIIWDITDGLYGTATDLATGEECHVPIRPTVAATVLQYKAGQAIFQDRAVESWLYVDDKYPEVNRLEGIFKTGLSINNLRVITLSSPMRRPNYPNALSIDPVDLSLSPQLSSGGSVTIEMHLQPEKGMVRRVRATPTTLPVLLYNALPDFRQGEMRGVTLAHARNSEWQDTGSGLPANLTVDGYGEYSEFVWVVYESNEHNREDFFRNAEAAAALVRNRDYVPVTP